MEFDKGFNATIYFIFSKFHINSTSKFTVSKKVANSSSQFSIILYQWFSNFFLPRTPFSSGTVGGPPHLLQ